MSTFRPAFEGSAANSTINIIRSPAIIVTAPCDAPSEVIRRDTGISELNETVTKLSASYLNKLSAHPNELVIVS